jgi:1-acyl-sn-glycerol-3-phosphate acyltransferase
MPASATVPSKSRSGPVAQAPSPVSVRQAPPPAAVGKAAPRTARGPGTVATTAGLVPKVSPWLLRWFGRYTARYLRRHFSHLWIAGDVPNLDGRPVIVFANHASWWDPLVCLHLHRHFFAGRPAFAPIDAAALQRYGLLARLGFFPVEQHSAKGAVQFLRAGQAILSDQDAMLWLTPQGEFQDPRVRPVRFKPGLAHLVERLGRDVALVPLAIDYFHGVERLPEVAVRFGEPISAATAVRQPLTRPSATLSPSDCERDGVKGSCELTRHDPAPVLEQALERTQDQLARDVMRRSEVPLASLLSGRTGIGGVYDLWRRAKAKLGGERFVAGHGDLAK